MPKKTILLVDDEAPILKVVEDILKPEGYNIVKAGNGKDVLKKLKKIMQHTLPNINMYIKKNYGYS